MTAFLPGVISENFQVLGAGIGCAILVVAATGASWHGLNDYRQHHGKKRLMFDPNYLIIFGLAVALIGVTWQQIRGVSANSSPSASGQSSSTTTKKKYFAYDIEARLQAIDALDTVLSDFLASFQERSNLENTISQHIESGTAPDILLTFANKIKPTIDRLNDLVSTFQPRFPDIARIIPDGRQFSVAVSIYSTTINLRAEILKWASKKDAAQYIQGSQRMQEWRQSMNALPAYINDARNELAKKRREYESADVYGPEKK